MSAETFVRSFLAQADVTLNGNKPWDVQIHDERVFARVLRHGSLGFGEAFMEGWIDCHRVDQLVERIYGAKLLQRLDRRAMLLSAALPYLKARLRPRGARARSHEVGQSHYDAGNDVFETMLDTYMTYSCGYWRRAEALDDAQRDKLELICRKLQLRPGQRVLDIGCGWGSFMRYAAERHGVRVVGVTVSEQQVEYVARKCDGLAVEVRRADYRDLNEPFDRIVSVGMFEHVGRRYHGEFFKVCDRCLKPGGLLLLHTIGMRKKGGNNPWNDKYIFPGAELPTVPNIIDNAGQNLILEDFHNWEGSHYDRTLMAWFERFDAGWGGLKRNYGESFYRMWKFYLQSCAGAFRADRMRVWQFVFSKGRLPAGDSRDLRYRFD